MPAVLATLFLAARVTAQPADPLEQRIAERARSFRGVLGVFARDLRTGRTVALDADTRFPTASTIKIAVMIEVFHRMAEGRLAGTQTLTLADDAKVGGSGVLRGMRAGTALGVRDLVYLMITLSDNTATNMLVDLVGVGSVNRRLAAYGLAETHLMRGTFRDGRPEAFPELEAEYGLGVTTPREMARLMELLAEGKVVSRAASEEMLAILGDQKARSMIPRALHLEDGVTVANKTGDEDEKRPDASGRRGAVRADAAVVTTPKGRYVVAIFTRRGEDTRESVDNEALVTGGEISRMIYDELARR